FSLAVDDFGTGYSSLSYLGRLPISVVKLAREFVGTGNDDSEGRVNRIVVEMTIQMSRRLGYQTIAEGVEEAPTVAYLESVGIGAHQGYFFKRPVPAEPAMEYLRYTGTPVRPAGP
ncbi:MAG: EAL domain-containing protein, partial [Dehalococcoidia bacterium]